MKTAYSNPAGYFQAGCNFWVSNHFLQNPYTATISGKEKSQGGLFKLLNNGFLLMEILEKTPYMPPNNVKRNSMVGAVV